METFFEAFKSLLETLFAQLFGKPRDYIWPLGNSMTPDEMNTSFGPRINANRWDFHDGIDLPAPRGTDVHAIRGGTVHQAGPAGTNGYSSRHVVVETNDPNDRLLYHIYSPLDEIDPAVEPGASVVQGQVLGKVGHDGAHYAYLHIGFRSGTPKQEETSVHPLKYLPYSDTANFTAPVSDRFNRVNGLMAARLLFGANIKSEGDLIKVEVELRSGPQVLATRVVNFHDKTTINKKKGSNDKSTYTRDTGVEGYQQSDMVGNGRTDLKYGILVRNIPQECDRLVARVFDLKDHVTTSAEIVVPNQRAIDERLDFNDPQMPPPGWTLLTSTTGTGTVVENNACVGRTGSRGRMLCIDASFSEAGTQHAGIEYALPSGRFEWMAEGWFNPTVLCLSLNQSIYLLYFRDSANLSVAARIRNEAGSLLAGIVARESDGKLKVSNSSTVVVPGVWRKWRLELLRIGTRETTAVLYLDQGYKLVEQARLNWDTTAHEPRNLRVGIGSSSSAGARAAVWVDEVRVTESGCTAGEA